MKKILLSLLALISASAWGENCYVTNTALPVTIAGCTFSGSLPSNSTSYIQNTLSPTTTTQQSSVQNSTVTNSQTLSYITSQCLQTDSNGKVTGSGGLCGSGGTITVQSPLSGNGSAGSPVIIATATTTSTGVLTSTDWNTFNNKGTVTSVTGSNGITSTGGATPNVSVSSVSLSSQVAGNLPVTNLNSGTSATSSTFWRGDGTWQTPVSAGGASTLAIATGSATGFTTPSSSPTAVINLESTQFSSALKGAATAYVTLNGSSVTLQGNNISIAAIAADTATLATSTGTLYTLANGKVNYSSFTATDPVIYNNATGVISVNKISLSSAVIGNLPVTNLNSGTSASASTFWRGDATWATPAGGSGSPLAVATGSAAGFTAPSSSPTAVINLDSTYLTSSLTGSATAFVSVTTRISNVASDTSTLRTDLTATGVSTASLRTDMTAMGVSTQTLAVSTGTLYTLANTKVNFSSFSATAPIQYNNATGAFTATLLSATTGFTGTLQAAQFPALTGDVTTSAGALATTAAASQGNIKTFTSSITVTGAGGLLVNSSVTINSGSTAPNALIVSTGAGTTNLVSVSTNGLVTTQSLILSTQIFVIKSTAGANIVSVDNNLAAPTDYILNISSANGTMIFGVQNNSHVISSGTAIPTVSSCGTSPTVDTTSTDFAGIINVGSASPTACTITFASAFVNTPVCVITDDLQTAEPAITTRSATAFTVTLSAALNSGHLFFICVGAKG